MRMIVSLIFFFFLWLAGQTSALSINVGGSLGSVSASDFLNVTDIYLLADCQIQCNDANSMISSCGTNDQCLCNSATVTAITGCQQCMFNELVAKFTTSTDPRAGSATALAAYATACAGINDDVTSIVTLTTPPDWKGPFEVKLTTSQTVVTVAAATLLGGGALLLLSNV